MQRYHLIPLLSGIDRTEFNRRCLFVLTRLLTMEKGVLNAGTQEPNTEVGTSGRTLGDDYVELNEGPKLGTCL